jgi:hypothetical protein
MKKFAAILALGLFAVGCGQPASTTPTPTPAPTGSHGGGPASHEMTNAPEATPEGEKPAPAETPAAPAGETPAETPAPANP